MKSCRDRSATVAPGDDRDGPRLVEMDAMCCSPPFAPCGRSTARARLEFECSKHAPAVSLSLGERAGVRAFVRGLNHLPVFTQRMWGAGLQLAEDRFPDRMLVPAQSRVPKSKFLNAQRSKKSSPFRIVSLLFGKSVSSAVQFDREPVFIAEKIQEVGPNRMSATKFISTEPAVAQPTTCLSSSRLENPRSHQPA